MGQNVKVVLVTGATSGIGKVTAEHLRARGYRVFAGARQPSSAHLSGDIEVMQLDVNDDTSIKNAVAEVVLRTGRIDALVNNAGVSVLGAIEETTLDQARALFETNFFGTLRMSLAVLPYMRGQKYGRIVNISSVVGFLPAPFMGVYAASKHAIEGLSESMDHEVRGFGVRIAIVEPGFTKTNIDVASARSASPISDYAVQRDRVVKNIGGQIAAAPDATAVAEAVERAINVRAFARLPVGAQPKMLTLLRQWMPAGMMDGALRKSFSLDG